MAGGYEDDLERRVSDRNSVFRPYEVNEINRRRLQAASDTITFLQEVVKCLESRLRVQGSILSPNREYERLLHDMNRYHLALTLSINSLPPEVLNEIFGFVISNQQFTLPFFEQDPHIVFTRICRYWRTVAFGNKFWNNIVLTSPMVELRRLLAHQEKQDSFLLWTRVCQDPQSRLSVRMLPDKSWISPSMDSLNWPLRLLNLFLPRLKRLHVNLSGTQVDQLNSLFLPDSFDKVEELSFWVVPPSRRSDTDNPRNVAMPFYLRSLTALRIVGHIFFALEPQLCQQLTKAEFRFDKLSGGLFLHMLSFMPNLEDCVLGTISMNMRHPTMIEEITSTKLERLTLLFKHGEPYMSFFKKLTFPSLRDLEIRGVRALQWEDHIFESFIHRSRCPLERLCIRDPDVDDHWFPTAKILGMIPTLEDAYLPGFSTMEPKDWSHLARGDIGSNIYRLGMISNDHATADLLLDTHQIRQTLNRMDHRVPPFREMCVVLGTQIRDDQQVIEKLEKTDMGLFHSQSQLFCYPNWRPSWADINIDL